MHRALRALVEWGTEEGRQGRPVGPRDEQRKMLAQGKTPVAWAIRRSDYWGYGSVRGCS